MNIIWNGFLCRKWRLDPWDDPEHRNWHSLCIPDTYAVMKHGAIVNSIPVVQVVGKARKTLFLFSETRRLCDDRAGVQAKAKVGIAQMDSVDIFNLLKLPELAGLLAANFNNLKPQSKNSRNSTHGIKYWLYLCRACWNYRLLSFPPRIFSAARDKGFAFVRVIGYIPCWHFYKTGRIMFPLHVNDLTIITGVAGEMDAKPVIPVSLCFNICKRRRHWIHLRRPRDISSPVCGDQNRYFQPWP